MPSTPKKSAVLQALATCIFGQEVHVLLRQAGKPVCQPRAAIGKRVMHSYVMYTHHLLHLVRLQMHNMHCYRRRCADVAAYLPCTAPPAPQARSLLAALLRTWTSFRGFQECIEGLPVA